MTVNVSVTGSPRVVVRSVEAALRSRPGDTAVPWTVGLDPPASGGSTQTADPDVVVVVSLGDSVPTEIDLTRRRFPSARVVWLAGDPDGGDVADAVSRGCSTVITGRSDVDDLVDGVQRAARGESWTTPEVVGNLLSQLRTPRPVEHGGLSQRELEVMALLRSGASTATIAETLFISPHTAKNHVRRILRKLGAHSRLEAVAIADRRKVLDPPDA